MNELLLEIAGWLGYLERGPVQLQLLVLLAVRLLPQLPVLHRRLQGWPKALRPLPGIALALLISLPLAAAGVPMGLLRFLTLLWLGWVALGWLQQALPRWLSADQVHGLMSRLVRPGYLVLALLALINRLDSVQDVAVIAVGRLFSVEINLGKVLSALVVLYLLMVGSGPPSALVAWVLQRLIGFSEGSRKALELILRYAMVGLGIAAVGYHLGFNSTALLAVAGGLSVGLGFGIKEVFSNFVSGLWLLFEGSVRPGEVLMIDGDPCEVRRLGLRATLLWRDRDNAELLIPNQTFFTDTATTYTATDRLRRSQVSVGAAYRHDPARVIALLEATALTVPRVLRRPAPKALLLSYGDSAINYALRFWIANPMDNVGICSEVNQAIWTAFAEQGIEIPFPQQVQHRPGAQPPSPERSPRQELPGPPL
ncbi:mechanosensitive ion channel family protein [Synechococcus sp. CBW1004]|jgi:potassium efflux system protein|uniref:mechanosensitive ion channel family protein n=1 Tax=Synechococcus sp. CBW1004 TaxID=1353136 RepID=UPI0018CFB6DC|nr:mechanosensitive ion channel domain-containing protein [Synechococcus sp. CBW1004]QPN61959.1 mechanosensitive ion channel [Synechococcus sp. CBW1004]